MRRLSGPSVELVVKSPHPNALLGWFGRRAIQHEAQVYERLGNIEGVPRSFGLAASAHLVLEHVDGTTLRQAAAGLENRERFFDRLLETIRAMHAAGIAHGDLKRKDNTLVTGDERPCIIDFGVATIRDESTGAAGRRRFDIMRQMDLNAWIKLKYGPFLDQMSSEDATLYRPLAIERFARRARTPWRLLTLRKLRKRRRSN